MLLSWLRPLFFATLTGCAALVACGLDTTGQGEGAPPVAKSELPEKGAEAVCRWFYQCGCDELDGNPFTSEDQCAADLAGDFQGAVDEGEDAGLTYDSGCAGDVLAYLEELGCDKSSALGLEGLIELLEIRDCKLYYGEDEAGASCDALTLSSGDSCVADAECQMGTCVTNTVITEPDDPCEPGDVCTDGALCVDVEGMGDFVCKVLPGESGTCLGALDMCAIGYSCDQTTKKCEVAPDSGSQCASTPFFPCAEELYCGPTNICTTLPPAGEDCVQGPLGPQCAAGSVCDQGTCVADDPLVCDLGPIIFNFR